MGALWAGVSGLQNNQTRMNVIGNNIANVNTVGFKTQRVTFQDMLSQTIQSAGVPTGNVGGTNPVQVGTGVAIASVDTIFTDGDPQATGKSTDLAIAGNGFFQVSSDGGITNEYTRDGSFDFDTNGNYVVPSTGYKVMGYQLDASGKATGTIGPINIPTTDTMPAKASTELAFGGNVSASATSATMPASSATTPATNVVTDANSAVTISAPGGAVDTAVAIATDPNATGLTADLATAQADAVTAQTAATNYQAAAALVITTPNAVNNAAAATAAQALKVAAENAVKSANALVSAGAALNPAIAAATTTAIASVQAAANKVATSATIAETTSQNAAAALYSARQASAAASGAAAITVPAATAASVLAAVIATPGVTAADIALATNAANFGGPPVPTAASVATALKTNLTTVTGAANTSSDMATSLPVYDSLGTAYDLNGTLEKTAADTWTFTPNSTMTDPATGATMAKISTTPANDTVTIKFDPASGAFSSSYSTAGGVGSPFTMMITPTGNPTPFTITPNFSAMTQYDSTTTAQATTTDGYTSGTLQTRTVNTSGMFVATYTNGQTQNKAQVALFDFNNPGGLMKTGGNMYTTTNNSGVATKDQTSTVDPGNLEMSNVDLSAQFSDMIVTQRGFQANSKTITTVDTMLQDLLDLKR